MAYRLFICFASVSSGKNRACKSGALVITNINAQIPNRFGMIIRIANEIEDHLYCRLRAVVLSIANALATAVGQSAQFTIPRKNIHARYSHPKPLSASVGSNHSRPLSLSASSKSDWNPPTLSTANHPVIRMPTDKTTN